MGEIDRMFDDIMSDINEKRIVQYTALILDCSGSMGGMKDVALATFNEQIQTIRGRSKEENIITYTTVILFNDKIDVVCENLNSKKLKDLGKYKPDSNTALYDAIGRAIEIIEPNMNDDKMAEKAALLIIVTDGWENSSKTYTREMINDKIKELKATDKWTFTFMCTNTDPLAAVNEMSFNIGSVSTFNGASGMSGSSGASARMSEGISTYYAMRNKGVTSTRNFYTVVEEEKEEEGESHV